MEFPETVQRGKRKENIPPAFSCPKSIRGQSSVQNNLDRNLFLTPGRCVTTASPQAGSNFHGSHPPGRDMPGRLRAAPVRKAVCDLIQTNLAGPYGPSWHVPKSSLPRQQSNLDFKILRRRPESERRLRGLCPLCPALCSCSGQVGLKRSPSDNRSAPFSSAASRTENKDRYLLKPKQDLSSASKRGRGHLESSPASMSGEPSPGSLLSSGLLPTNFNRGQDFLPSGPGLTLESLNSSILVEGCPSAPRQALLQSSQRSADRLSGIPWLQEEVTSAEVAASLPRESNSSCQMSPLRCKAQGSTTARFRGLELSAEDSYFGQASSSAWLAYQEGDDASPRWQQATDNKDARGRLRTRGCLNRCDPDGLSSGGQALPCNALCFCGLQMSPESLADKEMSMYDSRREELLVVHFSGDPEVPLFHSFGDGMEGLTVPEAGGAPIISKSAEEGSPFFPEVKPRRGPGKCARSANKANSPDANLDRSRRDSVSFLGQKDGRREASTKKVEDGVEISPGGEKGPWITVGQENLGEDSGSMERRERSEALLAKSFLAWHGHVCGKRDVAWSLYKRHLLQKGVCALKWAVQLGKAQGKVAEKCRALVMLTFGFRKWQDAAVTRHKLSVSQERSALSCGKVYPPALGRKLGTKSIPPEHLEGAPRSGRAGSQRWLSLEEDKLSLTAEARQDLRRLAGAVGRQHLRREQFAPAAALLLEKTTLGAAFRRWLSCCRERQRVRWLVAWLERGLIGRCLAAWKRFAQWKARSQLSQERLRAKSLRVCFQQWSLMVREREKAKRTVVELLAAKWQRAHAIEEGRAGALAPGVPKYIPGRRWPRRNGDDALDDLFHLRVMQEAFRTWRARSWEAQRAGAFRQALAHQRLQEALVWWRWRTLGATPGDSRLLSFSAFQSSNRWERVRKPQPAEEVQEIQLVESSPICIFSLVAAEDVVLPPRSHCPGDRNHSSVAAEFPVLGTSLHNWHSECHNVRPGPQDLPERQEGVSSITECGWTPGNYSKVAPSVVEQQWLRDKYVKLWRRNIHMRRFRNARDTQQLVKGWLLWKDAFRTELVAQELAWRRWALWAWKIWRRRWLQLQVAGRFQEAGEKQLLKAVKAGALYVQRQQQSRFLNFPFPLGRG